MKIFHTCHQKSRSDGDGLICFTIKVPVNKELLTGTAPINNLFLALFIKDLATFYKIAY